MERIAKEGMWLTKTPQNKRNRKFYTKISGTPASLDAFEEVTDKFKADYEKWLADEYKKDAAAQEED